MKYTRRFTVRQWTNIENAARARLDPKVAAGVASHVDTGRSFENEVLGIAAELTVCEFLGLSRTRIWKCYGAWGDPNPDHVLFDNRSLSIKGTNSVTNGLIFPPSHPLVENVVALVALESERTMWVRGWLTPAEFFSGCKMRDLGRGCGPQEWHRPDRMNDLGLLVEAQAKLANFDF